MKVYSFEVFLHIILIYWFQCLFLLKGKLYGCNDQFECIRYVKRCRTYQNYEECCLLVPVERKIGIQMDGSRWVISDIENSLYEGIEYFVKGKSLRTIFCFKVQTQMQYTRYNEVEYSQNYGLRLYSGYLGWVFAKVN